MSLSGHSGVWTRFRHKSHSGALRRIGQSDYHPRGPEDFTPSYRYGTTEHALVLFLGKPSRVFSELCTKCGSGDMMSETEEVDCDLDDAFFVMDSLDTIPEEDEEETLEMISQSEDSDSGLESSDDDYRNFKIFG